MKPKTQPKLRRAVICLFLSALCLLQGCLKVNPNGDGNGTPSGTDSQTVSRTPYLYESMTYIYKTDQNTFLSDILTGMDAGYLLLVNKQHPVVDAYELDANGYILEAGVLLTAYAAKSGMYLEGRATRALYAMLAEMAADGITDVKIQSAYRSQTYQNSLFNNYWASEQNKISEDARAFFGEEYIQTVYRANGLTKLTAGDAKKVANFYSAFPGQSEHHTGLCVDFVTSGAGLTNAFANTEAGQWLLQNCYRFGFILRYPENKTDITGYCYEPWHYRFVGREAATEIMLRGLTLEEFLEG